MQFEIIYAGTQVRLREQIDKKLADGWETRGEAVIIEPEVTTDLKVPKFVYFSQTVIRND